MERTSGTPVRTPPAPPQVAPAGAALNAGVAAVGEHQRARALHDGTRTADVVRMAVRHQHHPQLFGPAPYRFDVPKHVAGAHRGAGVYQRHLVAVDYQVGPGPADARHCVNTRNDFQIALTPGGESHLSVSLCEKLSIRRGGLAARRQAIARE